VRNGVGGAQTLVVFGGGSDIALATAHEMIARGTHTVVLAAREPERLAGPAAALRVAGARRVECVRFDAQDVDSHPGAVERAFAAVGADVDVVLVAFAVLGPQGRTQLDHDAVRDVFTTNAVGGVSATAAAAQLLLDQGHGTIIVLSSVAAERARPANYLYGASKAALDSFAQGLGHDLHGTGVDVMVVRPGFVHTKMTEGLQPAPLSTTARDVAAAIADGLRRGSSTVWAPGPLRWLMSVVRHLPGPLLRRLPR
jgi:decaprenylphospho-beta-D-erythro-pentofuranosid-2-ulose 2-reductase